MWQNPTLFPQITNHESWVQTAQIFDDDTGDLIDLTDGEDNAAYAIALDIMPPRRAGYSGYVGSSPWYDWGYGEPVLHAYLAQGSPAQQAGNWLSIVDTGTINIQIPVSRMKTLRGTLTYDVFLRLEDTANDDARQVLIGRLPVIFGGRAHQRPESGGLP